MTPSMSKFILVISGNSCLQDGRFCLFSSVKQIEIVHLTQWLLHSRMLLLLLLESPQAPEDDPQQR